MRKISTILSLLISLNISAQVVIYSGDLSDQNYPKLDAVKNTFTGYIVTDSVQFTVPMAKAAAYISTPVGTNTTTASQYYFMQGAFTNTFAQSFGTVGDTLQYQNGSGKTLYLSYHFTVTSDKNSSTVTIAIYINNSIKAGLTASAYCKTAGDLYDIGAMNLIRLNNGDKVKIMIKNDVANSVTTATQGSTVCFEIH